MSRKLSWLSDIAAEWGNADWAAPPDFVKRLIDVLPVTRGGILECGSGLTTMVIDRLLPSITDRRAVSLEHDAAWYQRVRSRLSRVDLRLAPIRYYGPDVGRWYEAPQGIDDIGLVVCDGPPAAIGRHALMPLMHSSLRDGAVILMDDAERERPTLDRWRDEYAMSYHIESKGRGIGFCIYKRPEMTMGTT